MYTIQFAQRAHFLSDAAADNVLHAIRDQQRFVTVPMDLAADGGPEYVVTVNVSAIVALIQHRREVQDSPVMDSRERAHLVLVN